MIHVETMSASFKLETWAASTLNQAEQMAHDLSVRAIGDLTRPNPFLVVKDGIVAIYDGGEKIH